MKESTLLCSTHASEQDDEHERIDGGVELVYAGIPKSAMSCSGPNDVMRVMD